MKRFRGAARGIGLAFALVATLTATAMPAIAAATRSRASLIAIENDLMCVACHESLAVAQSPEAFSERAFIRGLISQGLDQQQIERQMVAQYSSAVLAKPPATGFNLLIYVVPPALLAVGVVTLAITLPRWRRRARWAASPLAAGPALSADDARRLDEDMGRQL